MKYIDMHCDTLSVYALKDKEDLFENTKAVDIKRLKKTGAMAQFFAVWLPDSATVNKRVLEENIISNETKGVFIWNSYSDEKYFKKLYEDFKNCVEKHNNIITHVSSYGDYLANKNIGRISAFLTVEDGRITDGKLKRLDELKKLGVSLITLTWNNRNCFGSANSFDESIMNEGLTAFGKEAVIYMQDKGIIVDVAHLSDGGFYDVSDICKKPFIASHSNARALSPHPRNLTDDMLRILGERGGAAGLNFCPYFLNKDINDNNSTVEQICSHAVYMTDKGGADVVAIGSDLDGIEGNIEIDSADKMELLFEHLKKAGFKESEIEKILYKNAERIIKELL